MGARKVKSAVVTVTRPGSVASVLAALRAVQNAPWVDGVEGPRNATAVS
jgi:hypothetical protein